MSTFTHTSKATPTVKTDTGQAVSMPEHLSALLDDEAGSFEQKRVLNELKAEKDRDDNLHKKLSNYALIGETLRSGQPAVAAGKDFLSGIHEQLASEPEYSSHVLEDHSKTDNQQNKNSWLRPVGGFAMAASLAALAVIGFQNYVSKPDRGFSDPGGTEVIALKSIHKASDHARKDRLTQAEMDAATVVSADRLETQMLAKTELKPAGVPDTDKKTGAAGSSPATNYRQADARTRSLLKHYVDSHMQYASTTAFVPSIRIIAYSDY